MLVRVLEIPPPSGHFHFDGGEPQTFIEVDWFRDDHGLLKDESGRERCVDFIRAKKYFTPRKAYLVLTEKISFTIGYRAP